MFIWLKGSPRHVVKGLPAASGATVDGVDEPAAPKPAGTLKGAPNPIVIAAPEPIMSSRERFGFGAPSAPHHSPSDISD